MKILRFAFVFFILAASVVGCKYDDEELWNRVNSLEERIESLESQLTSMNKDISSISTVVNALQNNLSVTSIEETENGYTLTFSDDQKITIKNGTDGEDGSDAPIIGVDLFEGKYYWTQTIDGTKTWLTDAKGNKFPVAGESGVTPRLKVSATGHWMVSYDNGISYTEVLDEKGKPVQAVGKDGEDGEDGKDGHNGSSGSDGKDGDSFFKDVKVDGDELVLVLKDGMEIRLEYTGGSTEIQTTTTKGTVDLEDVEGLKVVSLVDEATLQQKDFTIETIENNLPQLVFVTDEKDNIIMMARGYFASQTAEVNAQSTALALVSMMLPTSTQEDFDELSKIITSSSLFTKVQEETEKSIKAKKDIYSETNTNLMDAVKSLLNSLFENPQTRAYKEVEGIDANPLNVRSESNVVSIRNTGANPPYECQITYGGEQTINKIIPIASSYGVLDVILQNVGNNRYGKPLDIPLTSYGEYNFYCDKSTLAARNDLSGALLSDVVSMVGFDSKELGAITLEIISKTSELVLNCYLGTLSADDFLSILIDGILVPILSEEIGEHKIPIPLQKETLKLTLNKIKIAYDMLKGAWNESARIIQAVRAPSPISFNLCYYSEITSCTRVSLTKVEKSDNQIGEPNKVLDNPIEVLVSSIAEDGTTVLQDYLKVKFEVTSGGGTISTLIAPINESGFASTNWTLGVSGSQTLRAVVINEITNTEISEPVTFKAFLPITDDRQALIDLYNATGGDNWTNNTNWCSDKPLDEWYGVTTNEEGRVIRLELDDNGAYGLGGNNIIGSADFSKLTELQYISCSDSKLTAINVSGLTKLETLYCGNNELTTLDVSGLINLRFLEFADNKISNIEISGLNDLEYIRCDYNELTSLLLSDLPNLKNLVCPFNPLTTLDVSKLTNLELLRCEDLLLSQIDVSNLTQLKSFECQNNNITNLDVSNLKNLEYFMCHNNQLNSLDVSGLTKLATLHCNNNSIQDLDLSGATGLQSLSCSNNQLANLELPQAINLTYLECSDNQLTTLNISGLSNLNTIYARGNDLLTVYLSSFPEHFSYQQGGIQDREQYPSPNHIDGYQYPEFIYQ